MAALQYCIPLHGVGGPARVTLGFGEGSWDVGLSPGLVHVPAEQLGVLPVP